MEPLSARYRDLLDRLAAVRRKRHLYALSAGLLAWAAATITLLTLVVVLEQIFSFGIAGRTALFVLAGVGTAALLAVLAGRSVLVALGVVRSESDDEIARLVGDHVPSVRDRLLDALQLYQGRDALGRNYAVSLIDASLEDLYRAVETVDFTVAVDDHAVRRFRRAVVGAVGLALFLFVVAPGSFLGSVDRVWNHGEAYASPKAIRFTVSPGNAEVVRGQSVAVEALAEGAAPAEEVTLHVRREGELEFEAVAMRSLGERRYAAELASLKLSTEYYVTARDLESDRYKVTVVDRPLLRSLSVQITPPAYTRLPQLTLPENTGDVTAYAGSTVRVRFSPSKPLASALLAFGDSTRVPCRLEGGTANASFVVRRNGTYRILLEDGEGLTNADPVEFAVRVIADAAPSVELVSPGKNVDLAGATTLPLLARAKDDFGFSRVRLGYRLAQSRYEQPGTEDAFIEIPLAESRQAAIDIPYLWDLAPLHLVPEDAVAYFIEVFDNDAVTGPKSARSETFLVRLPSLEEVLSDVAASHEQSMESMQDVARETQQMKKDVEELQREMRKPREKADWQQQKKAEQMAERYEAMQRKLEETAAKMDDMVKKMEENSVLSPQTMEKYKELQKLMDELKSPELQEALKKLQESMKQLTPEQMKQAMDQVKSAEAQFRESLERTIDLLKRVHIEQKIDELVKRAEELRNRQEALRSEGAKTDPKDQQGRDALAKKQTDLAKDAAAMEKEAADLRKKMEEFAKEMPVEEMAKAQEQLAKSGLQKSMQSGAAQAQSGDMQQAGKEQEKSEQSLEEFRRQMEKVQQAMQDKQMKQIVNEMRRQIRNAVELSKRQEALKDETAALDPNSQRFRENAQRQNEVMNDLTNVAQALTELAKKTFAVGPEMGKEIGNALGQMGRAMEQMEGRNPGGAANEQLQAMGSLNRAAMMMQGALTGMMQGGKKGMGSGGMMQSLQQMAGQQGGINAGTQQAMGAGGQGQQGMLGAQQQSEYQRLAGQQASLQKSLEQLAEEAKNSGEFSKLLGDLDQVAREMQEVQSDLAQGDVNPETVKKQDRILSRLLESTRSMRERDYEKRRTASAGSNVQHASPAELDLSTKEGKNRLRDELRKVLEGRYAKDYEELIRKYYEELEKENPDELR